MSQMIEVMSDVDLLGMMVGSKTAARMLQDAGGRLSTLLNVCPASYEPEPKVKTKLLVAKELVRRSLIETMRQRDVLASPESVRDYLRMTLAGRDYEVFMVLFLDAQNRILEAEEMFRGTLTQTSVDFNHSPADLLKAIDKLSGPSKNRSEFIETAVRAYIAQLVRRERNAHDLEILNKRADRLNEEALDVLAYQGNW